VSLSPVQSKRGTEHLQTRGAFRNPYIVIVCIVFSVFNDDKTETTKKFLSMWEMEPLVWDIILSKGQVNFTLLDQEVIISTIAAARKEYSEPFDAKIWVKEVGLLEDPRTGQV